MASEAGRVRGGRWQPNWLRNIFVVSRLVVVSLIVGIATLVSMTIVSVTIAMLVVARRTGMAVVPVAKAVARPGVVVRT